MMSPARLATATVPRLEFHETAGLDALEAPSVA